VTFEFGNIFWFNIFYNLGVVLRSSRNLFFYFRNIEYTKTKTRFQVGQELGTIFWNLFFPAELNIDTVLGSGGTWQQDWTWDN
jgi:hypothetical protein